MKINENLQLYIDNYQYQVSLDILEITAIIDISCSEDFNFEELFLLSIVLNTSSIN